MKPALANARVEAGAFVIMEGAGRDDELVQQGSGASYPLCCLGFPLIAGKEDRPPEDAQSQEDEKVKKNERKRERRCAKDRCGWKERQQRLTRARRNITNGGSEERAQD